MNYIEIKQDLFQMDHDYTLAHAVSKDCAMGAGIAKEFRRRFPELPNAVREAKPNVGDAVMYQLGTYKVVNLITKEYYWQKPTYETFERSICSLKDVLRENNIQKLAIPKIGAGLDRLNWDKNRKIIQKVFEDTNIEIVVCVWK